jgi:glycosyltransferase involved in cell wall biosynthesis
MTPRVVLLRGTAASPWELTPWERLRQRGEIDVRLVVPPDNLYDVSDVALPAHSVRTVGSFMPPGAPGRLLLKAVGQRHIGLAEALQGADVVHAAELGYWFSYQAARLKPRLRYRLVLTVWETLPFGDAYRNLRTRRYRKEVVAATDLYLAVTERARDGLLLEGVPEERIRICPPGIDVERFAASSQARSHEGPPTILSIGRLVWEKGHQDILRAVALLRQRGYADPRVVIVGVGPERGRLVAVARDLGLEDRVEFRGSIAHDQVPDSFAQASCLVLASLPTPYWEEQFGMVLAEAMAGHVPVVAAASGAIPEVLGGYGALFEPGDFVGLATLLAEEVLRHGKQSAEPPTAQIERYSSTAAADRLGTVYRELLAG